MEVVLVAIKADLLDDLNGTAESSGFRTQIVDAAPVALYNAFRYNYSDLPGCSLLVDLGARTTNLIFIEPGKVFSRSINIGGNTITTALAKEFQETFVSAEERKKRDGYVSLGGAYADDHNAEVAKAAKIIRNTMTRLHSEISRTINFYRAQQNGSQPARLFLCGGTANLPYLREFFAEKFQLPLEYFNPLRNVTVTSNVNVEEVVHSAHLLGELVGLGLRSINNCPMELNLRPTSVVRAQRIASRRPYFVTAGLCLLLALAGWWLYFLRAANIQSDVLSEVNGKVAVMQGFESKFQKANADIQKINTVAAPLNETVEDRQFWAKIVNELNARLPEKYIWITSLQPTVPSGNKSVPLALGDASKPLGVSGSQCPRRRRRGCQGGQGQRDRRHPGAGHVPAQPEQQQRRGGIRQQPQQSSQIRILRPRHEEPELHLPGQSGGGPQGVGHELQAATHLQEAPAAALRPSPPLHPPHFPLSPLDMDWIRNNKFMAGFLAFMVAGVGALGYLLYTSYSHYDEVAQQYDKQVTELKRLQQLQPFPDDKGLKKFTELRRSYASAVSTLQAKLAAYEPPPENPPLTPIQFADKLRKSVEDVTGSAQNVGMALPENFYLGFEQYRGAPPEAAATPLLSEELDAINDLVALLLKQHVEHLTAISRGRLPHEAGAVRRSRRLPPPPAGPASRHESPADDLVVRYPVDISFTAQPSALRAILNEITAAKRLYVIRAIQVKNQMDKAPLREDPNAAVVGGTDPAAAAASPDRAPERRPERGARPAPAQEGVGSVALHRGPGEARRGPAHRTRQGRTAKRDARRREVAGGVPPGLFFHPQAASLPQPLPLL